MHLFVKTCATCGGFVFGPREGGKARGRWLGYDECLDCRKDNRKPADIAKTGG